MAVTQSHLLFAAAAISGVGVFGHTTMGFGMMPNIRSNQKNLRALRGLWYQGSAWFAFTGLQLLRLATQGRKVTNLDQYDRLSYLLLQAIDAFYFAFYLRLGYRPPLLAYGGRLALLTGASYIK